MTCRHIDVPATPTMLRIAPQLGVLAILDEALTTTVCTLVAQHPTLGAASANEASSHQQSAARRLYDCLARCTHVLADYRLAVAEMVATLDEASVRQDAPDDIPF